MYDDILDWLCRRRHGGRRNPKNAGFRSSHSHTPACDVCPLTRRLSMRDSTDAWICICVHGNGRCGSVNDWTNVSWLRLLHYPIKCFNFNKKKLRCSNESLLLKPKILWPEVLIVQLKCTLNFSLQMNVDPEDLIPKLPKPRDLQPFPTTQALVSVDASVRSAQGIIFSGRPSVHSICIVFTAVYSLSSSEQKCLSRGGGWPQLNFLGKSNSLFHLMW